MDMRHGGLVLRDMNNASGTAEFAAGKKRIDSEVGSRVPHGLSDSAEPPAGEAQAIAISGAGTVGANGTYRVTSNKEHGAPVYQHVDSGAFRIARTAATSKKTGQAKHGWLLSQSSKPLYGAPTESTTVPSSGWRSFEGELPLPRVVAHARLAGAYFAAADEASAVGQLEHEREDWEAAQASFSAGLEALDRSGDRFGEPFERRAALLLRSRAACLMRMGDNRAALRDAVAAVELCPGSTDAEAAVAEAARAAGWAEGATEHLMNEAGKGRILDRGAPLALRIVEKWLEDVVPNNGKKAAYVPTSDYRQTSEGWTDCDRTRQVY